MDHDTELSHHPMRYQGGVCCCVCTCKHMGRESFDNNPKYTERRYDSQPDPDGTDTTKEKLGKSQLKIDFSVSYDPMISS